jgi:hypothetical protein
MAVMTMVVLPARLSRRSLIGQRHGWNKKQRGNDSHRDTAPG